MSISRQVARGIFAAAFLVAATAVTVVRSAAGAPPENRQTARAALDKALAKAKAWHADAFLIGVTGEVDNKGRAENGSDEGSNDGWHYTFRSVGARKRLILRAYSGGLETQETGLTIGLDTPLPGSPGEIARAFAPTFVDSDQPVAEALKNGFSWGEAENRYQLSLADLLASPAAPKEPNCWEIIDGESTSFLLSAKTGKLVWKGSAGH